MSVYGDNVIAFTSRTTAESVDEHVNHIIDQAIESAVAHYRAGEPGRGEFVLRRLALRLERLQIGPEARR